MAYKSIGSFDMDVLHEFYDDPTVVLEEVTNAASDLRVMEVGHDSTELWHDDYSQSDGAWVEAGEFEHLEGATDAARGFPDGHAVGVYDHGDAKGKLMVRDVD